MSTSVQVNTDEHRNNPTATDAGYVIEKCQARDQYVVSPGTGERILCVRPSVRPSHGERLSGSDMLNQNMCLTRSMWSHAHVRTNVLQDLHQVVRPFQIDGFYLNLVLRKSFKYCFFIIIIWVVRVLALRPLLAYCASLGL
jgi:hypothetical protein